MPRTYPCDPSSSFAPGAPAARTRVRSRGRHLTPTLALVAALLDGAVPLDAQEAEVRVVPELNALRGATRSTTCASWRTCAS